MPGLTGHTLPAYHSGKSPSPEINRHLFQIHEISCFGFRIPCLQWISINRHRLFVIDLQDRRSFEDFLVPVSFKGMDWDNMFWI